MKTLLLSLVIVLAGCAGQVAEPNYYLMRSKNDLDTRQLDPSSTVSLGQVVIASYIDQPGLLMETQSGEIRAARQHLWAEPIQDGVRNQLIVEISQSLGKDLLPANLVRTGSVLNVRIDQLHGTNKGTAKLVAYWWVSKSNEVVFAHRFAEEKALNKDGYGALLTAEEQLLSRLAEDIAITLAEK